jgi:hypothetical protein
MTTTVKIVGAGVEMEIEPELVDEKDNYSTLRRALSAVSPGMPKAKITQKKTGDNVVVEVTPKQECQENRNPGIDLYLSLKPRRMSLGSHQMYNLGVQAMAALREGESWIKQIHEAEEVLLSCKPASSSLQLPG